jgi:hypothetical protein
MVNHMPHFWGLTSGCHISRKGPLDPTDGHLDAGEDENPTDKHLGAMIPEGQTPKPSQQFLGFSYLKVAMSTVFS